MKKQQVSVSPGTMSVFISSLFRKTTTGEYFTVEKVVPHRYDGKGSSVTVRLYPVGVTRKVDLGDFLSRFTWVGKKLNCVPQTT